MNDSEYTAKSYDDYARHLFSDKYIFRKKSRTEHRSAESESWLRNWETAQGKRYAVYCMKSMEDWVSKHFDKLTDAFQYYEKVLDELDGKGEFIFEADDYLVGWK